MTPTRLACLAALSYAALAAQAEEGKFPALKLTPVWENIALKRCLWLQDLPDNSGRRWALEQDGRILLLPADVNAKESSVVLDISDRKPHRDNEEGLLSLALHPKFKDNRLVYLYYTQQNPRRSVISEWKASEDFTKLDPASERIVMEVPQPFSNHNGGQLTFGPDKKLYIGLGDGGAAGDPKDNGQNLNVVLGKILRIDVDTKSEGLQYGIPSDNPFANKPDMRGEIWAYGLRNPWRYSFDRKTGQLWAGEVGQNKWEEVDIIVKGGNYGWRVREGFKAFKDDQKPSGSAPLDPVIDYPHPGQTDVKHSPGVSITGGYVYRGEKIKGLQGAYLYADFAFGTVWALREKDGKATMDETIFEGKGDKGKTRQVASFAEDNSGELYTLVFEGGDTGRIYRIESK